MNKRVFCAFAALASMPIPAAAQFQNDGEALVKAVREENNNKAIELLTSRGRSIVNARDSKGDTALIIAITRRDPSWTGYLLREGADPNFPARNGDTPLIAAARVGFDDAAKWLIDLGGKVDGTNRMGETALIVAVQQRHMQVIRLLLERGANPDKTDSAAGFSARDYAKRDNRGGEILRLFDSKKVKPAATGPVR